jgi:hypothetical protein
MLIASGQLDKTKRVKYDQGKTMELASGCAPPAHESGHPGGTGGRREPRQMRLPATRRAPLAIRSRKLHGMRV